MINEVCVAPTEMVGNVRVDKQAPSPHISFPRPLITWNSSQHMFVHRSNQQGNSKVESVWRN